MTTVQPTPRPWHIGNDSPVVLYDSQGRPITIDTGYLPPQQRVAIAAFIVKAVNAHDELLAACKAALIEFNNDCWCTAEYAKTGDENAECAACKARAAIAKAEGTP